MHTDAPQPAKKDDSSETTAAAAAAVPQRLSLSSLAAVTRYPGVPSLLLMQGGANLAGSLMHSTFALVLQQRFQLSSRENGLVLSWVGVCIAVGESKGRDGKGWGSWVRRDAACIATPHARSSTLLPTLPAARQSTPFRCPQPLPADVCSLLTPASFAPLLPAPRCSLHPAASIFPTAAQAFVIKPASSYLGEDAAVKISSGLLALTFVAMGAATQLWQLLVCLMPLAAGSVMITTLNTARLSKVRPTAPRHTCASLREGAVLGGPSSGGGDQTRAVCVCVYFCVLLLSVPAAVTTIHTTTYALLAAAPAAATACCTPECPEQRGRHSHGPGHVAQQRPEDCVAPDWHSTGAAARLPRGVCDSRCRAADLLQRSKPPAGAEIKSSSRSPWWRWWWWREWWGRRGRCAGARQHRRETGGEKDGLTAGLCVVWCCNITVIWQW